MFCTNCGTENKDSSRFCKSCGKQLIHPSSANPTDGSNTAGAAPNRQSAGSAQQTARQTSDSRRQEQPSSDIHRQETPSAPDKKGPVKKILLLVILFIVVALAASAVTVFVLNRSSGSSSDASSDAVVSGDAATVNEETDPAQDTSADEDTSSDSSAGRATDGAETSGTSYSGTNTIGGMSVSAVYSGNTLTITYENTNNTTITLGSGDTFKVTLYTDQSQYSALPASTLVLAGASYSHSMINDEIAGTPSSVEIFGIYTSDMDTAASDGLSVVITLTDPEAASSAGTAVSGDAAQ